jgi:cytochrome c peroxidase
MNLRILAYATLLLAACGSEAKREEPVIPYPSFFPAPAYPEDNLPTKERIDLGRALFHDKRLSVDNTVNCASCHKPGMAMADSQPITPGVGGRLGLRNAPSLINVAWNPHFMMDGGVPTLELQALEPIQNPDEMGEDILHVEKKLKGDKRLQDMSMKAYGRPLDTYVIIRALASFQRTLVSTPSRFDRYRHMDDRAALSDNEIRGMNLFFGEKTQCATCHSGPLFTDYQFHNIGLNTRYADPGRERVSLSPADSGKFRTPSLRNVALTAPYMHNGSLPTLRDVIHHFNSGGHPHTLKSPLIRPLGLTEEEMADLEAFLRALSDS